MSEQLEVDSYINFREFEVHDFKGDQDINFTQSRQCQTENLLYSKIHQQEQRSELTPLSTENTDKNEIQIPANHDIIYSENEAPIFDPISDCYRQSNELM